MTNKLSPAKQNALHRLKIARGHLDKVISMLSENKYCLDVIQQSLAVQSALKKADEVVLANHLRTCVRDSMIGNKDIDKKVEEVIEVFKRK